MILYYIILYDTILYYIICIHPGNPCLYTCVSIAFIPSASEASTSTRRCHWLHLGLSPGSTGGAAKNILMMCKHTETYRNYMIIYVYIYMYMIILDSRGIYIYV